MSVYQIHGFQPHDAPHGEIALIEADDADAARAILLDALSQDDPPETVWGWGDTKRESLDYQDPANWRVAEWTPVRYILGGGCR